MANNVLAASGFKPGREYGGMSPNYAVREMRIAYNNSNKIAQFDPVIFQAGNTGYIDLMVSGGSSILGIFLGCEYLDATGVYRWYNQWPAPTLTSGTIVRARVATDPNMTYLVQASGGPATQACVGQNIDLLASSSGAPTLAGMSTAAVDYTTLATTATLPFRVVDIAQFGMNRTYDPTGTNPWLEVTMNTSAILSTTGR